MADVPSNTLPRTLRRWLDFDQAVRNAWQVNEEALLAEHPFLTLQQVQSEVDRRGDLIIAGPETSAIIFREEGHSWPSRPSTSSLPSEALVVLPEASDGEPMAISWQSTGEIGGNWCKVEVASYSVGPKGSVLVQDVRQLDLRYDWDDLFVKGDGADPKIFKANVLVRVIILLRYVEPPQEEFQLPGKQLLRRAILLP